MNVVPAILRRPIAGALSESVAIVTLSLMLLSATLLNGFPIIFYDTGAYLLQGFAHVFIASRSPVYSLFLRIAGPSPNLWIVAAVQSAIVAYVMVELSRALRPALPLRGFLALGLVMVVATSAPWYAGQIQPDCFAAVAVAGVYLLAFHNPLLGPCRRALLIIVTALGAAVHMTHLGVTAGLVLILAVVKFTPRRWLDGRGLPVPFLAGPMLSLAVALALVIGANYAFTKQVFISRSGAVFLSARLMQDGLLKPVLDENCSKIQFRLCRYKDSFPATADTWLWDEHVSPFRWIGGFRSLEAEAGMLVALSLKRDPVANLGWAVANTALQFGAVATGDGIVPQQSITLPELKRAGSRQIADYSHARQQMGKLPFDLLNIIHVPVALGTVLLLMWLVSTGARSLPPTARFLPIFLLLALLGNAFICGVWSGPHFRYQSRLVWLPVFALALLGTTRIAALRDMRESGT